MDGRLKESWIPALPEGRRGFDVAVLMSGLKLVVSSSALASSGTAVDACYPGSSMTITVPFGMLS